jgi:hypothetical protein
MRIIATDEQVLQMCVLAVTASSPVGMGVLHYQPNIEFKPEDFAALLKDGSAGVFLDYVQGRMVKLRMWRREKGAWDVPDTISSAYESWIHTYPTYRELALAAGAKLEE